jgi:hypothetical protein
LCAHVHRTRGKSAVSYSFVKWVEVSQKTIEC